MSVPGQDKTVAYLGKFVVQTAVQLGLYGVYTTFSGISIYFFIARGGLRRSKARLALLLITILMLINSTADMILNIVFMLRLIPMSISMLMSHGSTDGVGAGTSDVRSLQEIRTGFVCIERFNFLVSEAIIVWRAWVLFPHNRIVRTILGICLLGSYATVLVDTGLLVPRILRFPPQSDPFDGRAEFLLVTLPVLGTTIVATALISYKAWYHRKEIRSNLSMSINSGTTQVGRVLWFLVVSGLVYSTFWFAFAMISVAGGDWERISYQIYFSAMPLVSALFPSLIILQEAANQSRTETRSTMAATTGRTAQSMRFASRPTETVTSHPHSRTEQIEVDLTSIASSRKHEAGHYHHFDSLHTAV
ncbi:hypothetical protein K435DRAFT_970607 [Dendrothele bispora CBS 962.96]|uniref:Uncharacterized protein n=1 Tax=Dendrothele bispora (strain CBS 962.96) TaxID=1314807 RepID=A0A4S8LAA0_DENBC|nr:hypothetical protein K435DRAFT_970607 [Dendrothele bispora CBS 962.96]